MRPLWLLAILLAPVAAGQAVPPSMELDYVGAPEGRLDNSTYTFQLEVVIECAFFANLDAMDTYTIHVAHNGSANVNLTGPQEQTMPPGFCTAGMFSGPYDARFDVVMQLDRNMTPGHASILSSVSVTSTDEQRAPPPSPKFIMADWDVLTLETEKFAKQPPVPQEQTTPGVAAPFLLAALVALALQRRD